MNVGKPVGSTESDVCYFEVDAVFNREPVELLEESTWTAGLRRRRCVCESERRASRKRPNRSRCRLKYGLRWPHGTVYQVHGPGFHQRKGHLGQLPAYCKHR